MADDSSAIELRRLRWQCRRGMKELDIVLTRFLDRDYAVAAEAERLAFQTLLEHEDPQIWDWLLGAAAVPEGALGNVVRKLTAAA